ncbi:MAG: 30S ribosomal protein S20 [bacterium]|nr:30S ribosomal protein S20 [bacterium]
MPKSVSAKKRLRQSEKRRIRNKGVRSQTRTIIKKSLAAFEGGEDTDRALSEAYSALDKAVKKGVIHRRQADRKKARLAARLNKIKATK